ncbi:MAG: tetratricopeptide repeat protein [Chthoniobacteraceae bacterium]
MSRLPRHTSALTFVLCTFVVAAPGMGQDVRRASPVPVPRQKIRVIDSGTDPANLTEPERARQKLIAGAYEEVLANDASDDAASVLVRAEALEALGRWPEAKALVAKALGQYSNDIELKFALYRATRQTGAVDEAKQLLDELDRLAGSREWAYRAPSQRVALGRIALLVGADPKKVLDLFYDPTRKEHPDFRGAWLAGGDLALAKNDFALAARMFGSAVKKFPEDPDAWFGLARAFAPSDTKESVTALGQALEFNPRHVGAHLLLAEHHIDAERYTEADAAIAEALKTNPHSPEAHALRAVLAHLRGDEKGEGDARKAALKPWPTNPAVPHLIGRKLSQKYRFSEGAALQREALKADADFLAAKAQLANDLLRLGEDDEGWKLAEEVQAADPYDVVAYNLVTLRDAIKGFRALESENFIVRMSPHEADVYGDRVLALLERAQDTLSKKYGLTLRQKTIVEIFDDQKDFAIRTFGLPGGSGYLGVCFGRVVTMNSPAARPGSTASWEAILWHEFTHVITLTLTKNKMPRWLSEGISVFEERQQRGSWGEQMKPRYRAMILNDEEFTPVSRLSGAFMRAKTPVHLGFAYYESSLVVQWLIEKWGIEKMKALLAELARGVEINAALAKHFAPIDKLDDEFADHARRLANAVGPKLDWTKPKPREVSTPEAASKFLADKPANYDAIITYADHLLDAKKWAEAKETLLKLLELYPEQRDADGAYAMLAKAQRELGEIDAEIATLTKLADLTPEATDAFARLTQIFAERKDWPRVLDYSARFQAVNPLRPEPHRAEAEAREALGQGAGAIAAYRTMLQLEPPDPPEIRYRLAKLLHAARDPSAKREVLHALEEAPRFRAAHELLLEITRP